MTSVFASETLGANTDLFPNDVQIPQVDTSVVPASSLKGMIVQSTVDQCLYISVLSDPDPNNGYQWTSQKLLDSRVLQYNQ